MYAGDVTQRIALAALKMQESADDQEWSVSVPCTQQAQRRRGTER